MPTYEYACPTCGIVEAFQSIKEDSLTKCPKCHKQKVTRMVSSGGGVIFKGSGFWETDYNRSKEYANKAKNDAGAPAEGKSDGAADAKTPATVDTKDTKDAKKSDTASNKSSEPKSPEPKPQAQAQTKKIDKPAPPSPKTKS